MERPLFDKPMSELREAFVRARFAEPNIFGLEDIEEWLKHRPNRLSAPGEVAWRAPAFHRYIADALVAEHGLAIKTLATCATPFAEPPYDFIGNSVSVSRFPRDAHLDVLQTLTNGGAKAYYSGRALKFPVLVLNGNAYVLDHPHGHTNAVGLLRLARTSDIWLCIYAEWFAARPKAEKARACLLRHYRAAVKEARLDAQRDFDEAVAVSADGTKIVKAQWVLVAEGSSPTSGLLFQASAFRQSKIRCGTTIAHVNIERWQLEQISLDRRELTRDRFLSYMLGSWRSWVVNETACLVSDTACRDILEPNETILFVDKNTCPSPLTEGGREIRI